MFAYKGFCKDLTCRGYRFARDRVNVTEKANCRQNGFHCAENPLDCLNYYGDWRNSAYFVVKAEGDLDEDGCDSKISCTHIRLLKELDMQELLLHALGYMVRHPERPWNSCVREEKGVGENGFSVVRGKHPVASGRKGDILALAKEAANSRQIQEVGLFVIDDVTYFSNVWYDVNGKAAGRRSA